MWEEVFLPGTDATSSKWAVWRTWGLSGHFFPLRQSILSPFSLAKRRSSTPQFYLKEMKWEPCGWFNKWNKVYQFPTFLWSFVLTTANYRPDKLFLGRINWHIFKGKCYYQRNKKWSETAVMFLNLGLPSIKVALGTFRFTVNPGREQDIKMTSQPGAPKATYCFKKDSHSQAHCEIMRPMCLILY